METAVKGVIGLGYVSLLIELVFLHVPSVASNRSIWSAKQDVVALYSDKFQWMFNLSSTLKLLIFFVPLLFIYCFFTFPALHLFGIQLVSQPRIFSVNEISNVLGMSCIIFGRLVTLSSVLTIRKDNSQQTEFHLHTDSLFSTSRNPGLLGMYIFMTGVWLCIPSIWFLLGLLFYISYMHLKVKMEEDFLSNKFGASYRRYFNQTGRYLS